MCLLQILRFGHGARAVRERMSCGPPRFNLPTGRGKSPLQSQLPTRSICSNCTHSLSNLHSRFPPELSSPLWSLARRNLYLPTHSRRAWKWWRSLTSSRRRSTHTGWCTLTSRQTCRVSELRSEKKIIMALNTYNMTG